MKIELVDVKSKLWEEFQGAYGNVSHEVAVLMDESIIEKQIKLRRLDFKEKDDYCIAFDNLCENLSHQMSFYKATYLALPYLVELFEKDSQVKPFDWLMNMVCQMGIILATDIANNHKEQVIDKQILNNYENSILKFQELTK